MTGRRVMRGAPRTALAAALLSLAAGAALAHGAGWRVLPDAPAAVVAFSYAGAGPMAFAEVTVTAPDGRVFQKGRADREGRFAFAPPPDADPEGEWVLSAQDGDGHRTVARLKPDAARAAAVMRAGAASALGWLGVGGALAALVMGALLWERRRAR